MTQKNHADIPGGSPANSAIVNAPLGQLDNAIADVEAQLGDFVVVGGLPGTSVSLTVAQPSCRAFVGNTWVSPVAQNLVMTASQDNYVDLDSSGVYHITPVALGAAAPAIFANSIRLYKAVASGAAVTAITDLRQVGPSLAGFNQIFKTKRATLQLSGNHDANLTINNVTGCAQRHAIILPVTTTRWRLRVHNWLRGTGVNQAGALSFTGVWLGIPTVSAAGAGWLLGGFTGAPVQALPAFVTDAGGLEYTSPWVTDPSLQFTAQKLRAISWGFNATAGTVMAEGMSNQGCFSSADTVANGAIAASAGLAALSAAGVGWNQVMTTSLVDITLEYEFTSPNLVGFFVGDSIMVNTGTALNVGMPGPHNGWPGAAGLRQAFCAINGSRGGDTTTNWLPAGYGGYARFDLATTVPDFAVIGLGYNDAVALLALATFKSNYMTIIANLQALGIQRIYAATILPGPPLSAAAEAVRQSYNAWLRALPQGITACWDIAAQIELAAANQTPNPYYVSTNPPHPDLSGVQRIADVVVLR